ncbi:MAG: putative spermidine/putrescine transport system substrate-binding protein [Chloroflexota bacterium]|jgi:putative spermidine/putrescine transport system substrate-binding protein|nr:putative spermidine/putrescine transport system substrate-binding protein [Chloroflexota bacterium]
MISRPSRLHGWAVLPAIALIATACGSGATPSPVPQTQAPTAVPPAATPAATAAASPTAGVTEAPSVAPTEAASVAPTEAPSATPLGNLVPDIDLSAIGGAGEGELNIIAWIGYAEGGENLAEYNWVGPFQDATGCQVNAKIDDTSDQMVTDMRQGGGTVYDGVSASGDASLRLISNGDVAEIDVTTMPDFENVSGFLKDAPHYVVDGKHYGTPHGWGGNLLMYNTEAVTPAPTSWDVVFDPTAAAAYAGKITAYDAPIYIADAALYLKAHNPDLGITNPYELTEDQLNAAVDLLNQQSDWVGKYWSLFGDEIDNFKSGDSVVGTAWPYQVNALKAESIPVESVVPTEGMTGWADTWMMSSKATHPNCMLKWMAWMLTPEVQAQVAEYFGEAPANPQACQFLDAGYGSYQFPDFCNLFGVNDPGFYNSVAFWQTPSAECGDERGATCTDFSEWTTRWTEIRG